MQPLIHAYLRASTSEQDASRARAELQDFAAGRGHRIASWHIENESGATLARPALFKLIEDAASGDVLLVEQVDRLSRLNQTDWEALKATLQAKRLRVVALDLPTSWGALEPSRPGDEFTGAVLDAVNRMLLDMLAVVARKDYTDRRRRQAQGIAKAKEEGRYRGRQADAKRHALILALLDQGKSWSAVQDMTGASRSTIQRAVKQRGGASQESEQPGP